MTAIPIQTERFILREFRPTDGEAILDIVSHPKFSFYAFPSAITTGAEHMRAAVETWLEQMLHKGAPDPHTGHRENYKLAIVRPHDDQPIGYVALDEVSEARGEKRDVGYFVHPELWGHGIATEAAAALIHALLPLFSGEKLWATVHPDNHRSQGVLHKLGFTETGEHTTNSAGEPRVVLCVETTALVARAERPRGLPRGMEMNNDR